MRREEVGQLLGMLRGAWLAGPTPERADDFAFAVRTWWEGLQRWSFEDALDGMELLVNGGQQRYPNLTQMIEAIQTVRRQRALDYYPAAIEEGDVYPIWDAVAKRAIWDGYVHEVMHLRRCSREEAEQSGRASEVLRPWLGTT